MLLLVRVPNHIFECWSLAIGASGSMIEVVAASQVRRDTDLWYRPICGALPHHFELAISLSSQTVGEWVNWLGIKSVRGGQRDMVLVNVYVLVSISFTTFD
jgi:hypothetical protein